MHPEIFILLCLVFFLLLQIKNKKRLILKKILANKKKGVKTMLKLAERFIGKECIIYTFDSQISGKIAEITDGGILVDNGKEKEIVNLDFVVRIREYPVNKNGKKKSIITD